MIRLPKLKFFSINTIIDFENNFINKAYFNQLILKFELMIFILKNFVKHSKYFREHLPKSISSRDFLEKLLQLPKIRLINLDLFSDQIDNLSSRIIQTKIKFSKQVKIPGDEFSGVIIVSPIRF